MIKKSRFSCVPNMIDYKNEYTDINLYKYFELTRNEIKYIEKSIKELEEKIEIMSKRFDYL